MNTRLLLLDINGLLCCKKPKDWCSVNLEVIELNSYKVVKRPGYSEFLDFCYSNFSVGFFSSTTKLNSDYIIDGLLTIQQRNKTVLMWFRDRTHFDPDCGKNSNDTIKKLQDIFDNPVINANRKYHSGNTILLDDSSVKTRFNDPKNIVICKAFEGNDDDQEFFEMMKIIPERFDEL